MTRYHWNPQQPFNELPALPPRDFSNESVSINKLNDAKIALAELRGYTSSLTNLHHLLHPLFILESLSSSEIENIKTTLKSVLEHQLENERDESADQKVLNYREALMWGWEQVQAGVPITERFIKGLHTRLLPHENHDWRREQNQIINESTKEIRYTPPENTHIPRLLSEWENFVNVENNLDPLVAAALAHYQFEAVHPFGDGNGRTGRMLLTLEPVQADMLMGPFVHISRTINKERLKYYELLLGVTKNEGWKEFVEYILDAYREQAIFSRVTLMMLTKKQEEMKVLVKEKDSKLYSPELIEKLFEYPIINPSRLGKELDVHYQTASKYLKTLERMELLKSYKKGRRMLYVNETALDVIGNNQ